MTIVNHLELQDDPNEHEEKTNENVAEKLNDSSHVSWTYGGAFPFGDSPGR